MLKKSILFTLISLIFCISNQSVFAADLPYKNIKDNSKLIYDNGTWSKKVDKKNTNYIVKRGMDLYTKDDMLIDSAGCEYIFYRNGSLIGYSNTDLKFYEFALNEDILNKRELLPDEVSGIFPNYEIIKITDFSKVTNSTKLKKNFGKLKIILLNDTDLEFENYTFTSGNAKFDTYPQRGFIDVTKDGMIQFSKTGEDSKNTPWFIILIR